MDEIKQFKERVEELERIVKILVKYKEDREIINYREENWRLIAESYSTWEYKAKFLD